MSRHESNGLLRSLLHSSALYSISNFLQRGLTFLLLPLYARYLTRSEFGAMEQLYQGVMILVLVTSLGLPFGLVRGFYLESTSEDDQKEILGALIAFLLPITAILCLSLWWAAEPLEQMLFREEGQIIWVQLAIVFYLVVAFQQLPLSLFRTRQQVKRYVAWSIASFILVASGNVLLIVVWKWGLTGMLLANIIGVGGTGIILWIGFTKEVHWNLEFARLKPLFAFSLPMLPALLARRVLEFADRYMIPHYHNLDELGLYVMGAKVAHILEVMLLVPFLYAWQPFFYSLSGNRQAPDIFARVTHYFFLVTCFIFLLLEISKSRILYLLGGSKFAAAESVITLLVLAVMFNGIQYTISPGIHLRKKLVQEAAIMIVSAGINLMLNWILIPPYKGMGAALATASAYLFYLVGTFFLAQRHYFVSYPWLRLANVFTQTFLAFMLLCRVDGLALHWVILAIYLFTCPVLDLWFHGEMKRAICISLAWSKGKK